jgi:hypothetical protein
MAALESTRKQRLISTKQLSIILTTALVAYDGALACIDRTTGRLRPGGVNANLLPVGTFLGCGEEGFTGDGTKKVAVRLHKEIVGMWLVNDGAAPVTAAHIGSLCYILDDQTVSSSSDTGARSVAGRVWDVSATKGVFVELAISIGPQGPQGEPG